VSDVNDFNKGIIEEFRANGGKVGGRFTGAPMLLLHTTGAKSGKERINPVVYGQDGDRVVIFGSKAGAPTNPDWYHNIVANPDFPVERGMNTFPVHATVLAGAERAAVLARWVERVPLITGVLDKTDRTIPVVRLDRALGQTD